MNKKIIIIPDVHGRIFWKDAVYDNTDSEIIFLGDYMDSYMYENGLSDDDFNNFKEIIDFKNNNADRVTLLIGNHDRHYMDNCNAKFSRYKQSIRLKCKDSNIFNSTEFKIAHEETINGKRFVFSHAGFKKDWLSSCIGIKEIDLNAINEHYLNHPEDFDEMVSFYRGGWDMCGSPIWADIREYDKNDIFDENTFQIIGHTQLETDPIFSNNVYCLDCRRSFFIDEEGNLREMNGDAIKLAK